MVYTPPYRSNELYTLRWVSFPVVHPEVGTYFRVPHGGYVLPCTPWWVSSPCVTPWWVSSPCVTPWWVYSLPAPSGGYTPFLLPVVGIPHRCVPPSVGIPHRCVPQSVGYPSCLLPVVGIPSCLLPVVGIPHRCASLGVIPHRCAPLGVIPGYGPRGGKRRRKVCITVNILLPTMLKD